MSLKSRNQQFECLSFSSKIGLGIYLVSLVLLMVFSFSLTDPNLVLLSQTWYWSFQTLMWRTFFDNPQTLAVAYLLVVTVVWLAYGWWSIKMREQLLSLKMLMLLFCLLCLPLLIAYNALSHDVFNYIFNAKMVLVYDQNPHVTVALNFPSDDWTRFMHNTHTAAPYGYGWTALSLLPFALGMQKFVLTWLFFRVFSMIGYGLSVVAIWKYGKWLGYPISTNSWLLVLSPFFLIEMVMNSHNDGWMLFPAILAVWWTHRYSKGESWRWLLGGAVALVISYSIKLATVALIPLILLLFFARWFKPISNVLSARRVPLIASILLFLPLLTAQSQWFHPWYLSWSAIWLPLIKQSLWKFWLIGLSLSVGLRYVPWLWSGTYAQGLDTAIVITWAGGLLLATLIFLLSRFVRHRLSV